MGLANSLKSLKGTERLEICDSIIQEQQKKWDHRKIIEFNKNIYEKVFYLPHRPVITNTNIKLLLRPLKWYACWQFSGKCTLND